MKRFNLSAWASLFALLACCATQISVNPCFGAEEGNADAGAKASSTEANSRIPTFFIVGDSTVKNGSREGVGWGERIGKWFDPTKVKVENRAIGGRSSRTFINEGRWDKILEVAQSGDFVIVQMGHNDGGAIDDAKSRGSLRGTGE